MIETSNPYRDRVIAIHHSRQSLERRETDLKATRKKYADRLTEATQALNAAVPDDVASIPDDVKMCLADIITATNDRKKIEEEKAKEIKKATKAVKRAKAAFDELTSSPVDTQMSLSLGDHVSISDTLAASPHTARAVHAALDEVESSGGDLGDDERALKARLEAMGLEFQLDEDDDDEEEEDGDDDEEDPPRLAAVQ